MPIGSIKAGPAILFLFATIGAIASVVTIIDFVGKKSSQLHATAHVNRLVLPREFQNAVKDDFDTDTLPDFRRMLVGAFDCNQPKEKRASKNDHYCAHLSALNELIDGVSNLEGGGGVFTEIDLENRGSSPARSIRIDSGNIKYIDLERQDGEWVEPKSNESGQFLVSDLNPGEAVKIIVFYQNFVPFHYGRWGNDQFLPKITYSDGIVDYTLYSQQMDSFSDKINDLGFFDWLFGIIVVVLGSFIVTGLTIIPFAMIDAKRKGRPISSVFKAD